MSTHKMNMIKLIILSLTSTLLVACSSSESHIPKSGITVEDVYYGDGNITTTSGQRSAVRNAVPWRPTTNYERAEVDVYTLHNSPKVPFRTLPNPTIYIYVPPKLSKTERIPIPGYFSEFKLMQRDEYALPGEVNLSNGEDYRLPMESK